MINTADIDSYGTVIDPAGVDLARFQLNPIVLINHDFDKVAGVSTVALRNGQLVAEMRDEDWDLEDPEIAKWYRKVKKGFVRGASIRFIPTQDPERVEAPDGTVFWRYPKWELAEWSYVSVNSNPTAVVKERSLEMLKDELAELKREIMSVELQEIETPEVESTDADQRADAPAESPDMGVAPPDDAPEEAAQSVRHEESTEQTLPEKASEKTEPNVRNMTREELEQVMKALVPQIRKSIRRSLGKE